MSTDPSRLPYQYVVLRCMPRIEREEFVNVGVVLYCQAADYLAADWQVDAARLRALGPDLDLAQVRTALTFVESVCVGDPTGGGAAAQPIGTRFGFLKAPRSTVLQPGPVHGGLTADPARELAHLLATLVA